MFAQLERLAVADRTGVALLGTATAARGLTYLPWTPDLHYTHPVEAVAPAPSWAVAWLATAAVLLACGLVRPKSKATTAAWSAAVMLHVFFGLSMAVALVAGESDGYLSAALCFCVAGFAVWGSAREKPAHGRTEVPPR